MINIERFIFKIRRIQTQEFCTFLLVCIRKELIGFSLVFSQASSNSLPAVLHSIMSSELPWRSETKISARPPLMSRPLEIEVQVQSIRERNPSQVIDARIQTPQNFR